MCVPPLLYGSISPQCVLFPDLFLIQPPEGAAHSPIKPSNIVVGGDSAGGGLALALLQVIRDAGLPQPAGAVLVSPWCDLFHSFPSIFLNTDTVIYLLPT
jgi:acetyl esterase/lipase